MFSPVGEIPAAVHTIASVVHTRPKAWKIKTKHRLHRTHDMEVENNLFPKEHSLPNHPWVHFPLPRDVFVRV